MTEEQFQECRRFMQKANYLRGEITTAKGEVIKWTRMEAYNEEVMRPGQAEGCKIKILKAQKRLDEVRGRFADLKFPSND